MRKVSLLLIILCLTAGCAASQMQQGYQIGDLSRVTAETAYKVMYTAYKDGHVSAELMEQADESYQTWQVLQKMYVDAVRAGMTDVSGPASQLQASLRTLLELAAQANVL